MIFQIGQLREDAATRNTALPLVKKVPTSGPNHNDTFLCYEDEEGLRSDKNYFLRFYLNKDYNVDEEFLTFRMYLTNNQQTSLTGQFIQDITLDKGTGLLQIAIIFTPEDGVIHREIGIEMQNRQSAYIAEISGLEFYELGNLVDEIASNHGTSRGVMTLKRVGMQTVPGRFMNINGELIRMGQTGIYEVSDEVVITSLGFPYYGAEYITDYMFSKEE